MKVTSVTISRHHSIFETTREVWKGTVERADGLAFSALYAGDKPSEEKVERDYLTDPHKGFEPARN